MTRRDLLRYATLAGSAALLAACQPKVVEKIVKETVEVEKVVKETVEVEKVVKETVEVEKVVKETVEVEKEVVKEVRKVSPRQAPMLQEMVKAGELPPLEERLPINPAVTPVVEKIGNYGGTWRRGFKGVGDLWGPINNFGRSIGCYRPDWSYEPDMIESWKLSENATKWTFHLRKGGKWSDGEPFTSGDFRYWFDHVLLNKALTPAISDTYKTGSGEEEQVVQLETPDDYTVVWKFAHPNPLFVYYFTVWGGSGPFEPSHYMRQFHMELTDDKAKLERQIKDAGFDSWDMYYDNRNSIHLNAELPSINPWLYKSAISEEVFEMVRNPYFMGVDPEGNQLPYIDKVVHRLFITPDVFDMWIVSGEIDFQSRHVGMVNYTLYKENEEKGDYKVLTATSKGHVGLNTNQACKDPYVREFFQNRDVRIALSVAVDRETLNELVYDGLLPLSQCAPVESSPYYWDELFHAYTEYDPDKANELLDKAGYTERDSEGFRLWKDGSGTAGFVIEAWWEAGSQAADAIEVIIKYLKEVGLDVSYKYAERSLFTEHFEANELECGFWGMDRTLQCILRPDEWLGTMMDRPWAGAWGLWKNDPTDPNAEKPPEGHYIWDIWEIWDKVKVEPDADKRAKLFRGILEIWLEELPQVCYLDGGQKLAICKNGFRNATLVGENYRQSNQVTFFWEEPEKHV